MDNFRHPVVSPTPLSELSSYLAGMTTKKRAKRQSGRKSHGPRRPPRRNSSPFEPSARRGGPVRSTEASAPETPPTRDDENQKFLDEINEVARSLSESMAREHPLLFLLEVSQTYALYDRRTPDDPARIDLTDRLAVLAQCELAGFRAAGYAMSRMVGLDHGRKSFDEAYSTGPSELPKWLRELDAAEIAGCWRGYRDDEADTVVGIGIRFADGQEGTLVINICADTDEIVEVYLSFDPYAETALTWVSRDPTATGLSEITRRSAHTALTRAMANSEPSSSAPPDGRADWAHGRAIMEWAASVLIARPTSADR